MDKQEVRDVILEAMENGLEAQLRAVRKLRSPQAAPRRRRASGMSQIDMAYDVLKKAGQPLHVRDIIERAQTLHGAHMDRESLVSALTKRVARADRFVRTEPNTFGLRPEELP